MTLNYSNVIGDGRLQSKHNTKKHVHVYGTHFIVVNFYFKSLCNGQLYLHALCSIWIVCKIVLYICSIFCFVWILCVAFELIFDFGILRCTFITALVIFAFRLITLGQWNLQIKANLQKRWKDSSKTIQHNQPPLCHVTCKYYCIAMHTKINCNL